MTLLLLRIENKGNKTEEKRTKHFHVCKARISSKIKLEDVLPLLKIIQRIKIFVP